MSTDLDPNVVSNNAARAYEAETKRLEVAANAVLTLSKSANIDERTRGTAILNEARALGLHELSILVQRFHQQYNQRQRALKRLIAIGEALSHYKLGSSMPDIWRYPMWAAYRVLLIRVPNSVLNEWTDTPPPDGFADPANWVGRKTSGTPCEVVTPNLVMNVGDLLDWQSEHDTDVIVRRGSPPHMASLKALDYLDAAFAADAARYEAEIAAIQAGVLDTVKPQDLLKLSDPVPSF